MTSQTVTLYEYVRGSRAYGTNLPDSDTDTGGVFREPSDELLGLGLHYKDHTVSPGNDHFRWELGKFAKLLAKGNLSVLEMLFAPERCRLTVHPAFEPFLEQRDEFLTLQAAKNLYGYARSEYEKNFKKSLKSAAHALRMLAMCSELLREKTLRVDRTERDAEFLKNVRRGLYDPKELEKTCRERLTDVEKLLKSSTDLRHSVDLEAMNELVLWSRKYQ